MTFVTENFQLLFFLKLQHLFLKYVLFKLKDTFYKNNINIFIYNSTIIYILNTIIITFIYCLTYIIVNLIKIIDDNNPIN